MTPGPLARLRSKGPTALRAIAFRLKYAWRKRYRLKVDGVEVVFSTEDPVSARWFFPRYRGGRLHEPGVTTLLIEDLKSARGFVDVGAFLGYYTCIASRLMSGGQILSFEMDPDNFTLLEKNVGLNEPGRVQLHNVALADIDGHGHYVKDAGFIGARHSLTAGPALGPSDRGQETAVRRLDDFYESRPAPDLVKIDVEGAELRVLAGMSDLLTSTDLRLYVEIHPYSMEEMSGGGPAQLVRLLQDSGFSVFQIENARADRPGRLEPVEETTEFEDNAVVYATKNPPPSEWLAPTTARA